MNAGYYLGKWVLKHTKNGAIARLADSLGTATAVYVVTTVRRKGAWGAARSIAWIASKLGSVGGPIGAAIGISAGAL